MRDLFFSQKIAKLSAKFLLTSTIAILVGCTAGGTSSSTTPPPTTGAAVAATIQLSVSLPQILTTATSTTDLQAIVLDASGQAIAGKVVVFSTGNDSTAYFTNVIGTSDTNGVATATLNLGSNMANRTITVSATADTAVGTTPVTVVGTTIIISGNTSLSLGGSTALTVSVKNSSGAAVPGAALTVTSANGNGIVKNPATGITDNNGQLIVTVTATSATTPDTITVTGWGATATQSLTVTAASTVFAFTAPITIVPPATTPEILVNTPTTVSVQWLVNGVAQVGQTVSFYSTRGTFSGGINAAVTNGSGVATVTLQAANTGSTTISAYGPINTPTTSLTVVFVTNTASTVTAQASPGTIGVNSAGTSTNQSVISVVVRDAALNLVKSANVAFTLISDPSSGSLSAPVATTDINGIASVNYIAGATSSGLNQEVIAATVDSVGGVAITPISTTTNLTVAAQTYYVRLSTDNTIIGGGTGSAFYTKNYYALVTDVGGHAVPNASIGFTLRPVDPATGPSFAKGFYTVVGTAWSRTTTATCVSEDLNYDGFKQPGEDVNGNGQLDPYGVASVNATAVTDSTGFAIASIKYNKNYAYWAQLVLEARTQVTGNDPPALVTVIMPGDAGDYGDINVAPPGIVSPWGISGSCTDTN
jgi:hypothetical protein